MASKCLNASKDASKPKLKRRHLTIEKKMVVLNMAKEGKSYAIIARHFGLSNSAICRIVKAGNNIRKTAKITFNASAKMIISPCRKPLILMEAALVAWIVACSQKNLILNRENIRSKALRLHHAFACNETDTNINANDVKDLQLENSCRTLSKIAFSASGRWYNRFMKRCGLTFVRSFKDANS